ncbi:MAG: PHP domain-containing protein [archaeon]
MLLDLHSHSKYSEDGSASPEEMVKLAAEKGFGFAITEHNNCDSWPEFRKLGQKFNVPIIFGTEIKVFRGEKMLGEILCLFLEKPVTTRDFFEAVKEVHGQKGIVAAAHPFDLMRKPFLRGFDELPALKKHFDAVEVFNSRTLIKKFDARAKKFAKENDMPMICGSDAHTARELGNSLTEVKANNLDEAKAEILAGRTRLHCHKSSPFVHSYSTIAKLGLKKGGE